MYCKYKSIHEFSRIKKKTNDGNEQHGSRKKKSAGTMIKNKYLHDKKHISEYVGPNFTSPFMETKYTS